MLQPAPYMLQCMEVWGGNRAVENGVVMPGLDAWVFSRPYVGRESRGSADDTSRGGDIHYVTSCATGRITRIVVADVSGHGEKVADTAVELRRLLGRYSNYADQERVVSEIDRHFVALGESDARHAGLFATAVIATYWSPTEEVTLCNAGHPRPLRYRAREPNGRSTRRRPMHLQHRLPICPWVSALTASTRNRPSDSDATICCCFTPTR